VSTIGELLVRLAADTKGFAAGMAGGGKDVRGLEAEVRGSSGKISGALDESGRHAGALGRAMGGLKSVASIATGFLAAEGVGAIVDFGKEMYSAVEAEDKLDAQTKAVLKSTGGAAHVTAANIDEMAVSLSRMSGVDDEAIKNQENLLLTFTGIRNEAGKGNDVFSQATKAALDMSVALGEDGKSAAIQLGKALNDPIKGVTALQRVGVSFTADQKKQIETMVKSGRTMDAQKFILKELNREFGGSAAAQATVGAKIKVAWDEASKSLMRLFMPAINAVLGALPPLIDGLSSVISWVSQLVSAFMQLGPVKDTLALIGEVAGDVSGTIQDMFSGISTGDFGVVLDDVRESLFRIGPMVSGLGQKVAAAVPGIIAAAKRIGLGILDGIAKALPGLALTALRLWEQLEEAAISALPGIVRAVGDLLQAVFDWIVNTGVPTLASIAGQLFDELAAWLPVVVPKIVDALGQVVGTIVDWIGRNAPILAAKLLEWGQAFAGWVGKRLPGLLASLGDLIRSVLGWIGQQLPVIAGRLLEWGKAFIAWVGPQIPPLLGKLGELLGQVAQWVVTTGLPALVSQLAAWAKALVDWIGPAIPPLLEQLGQMLGQLVAWVVGTGLPALVGALGDVARAMVSGFITLVTQILPQLAGWVAGTLVPGIIGFGGDVLRGALDLGGHLLTGFMQGIGDLPAKVLGVIGDAMSGLVGAITAMPGKIADAARGMFDGIWQAFRGAINSIIRGWNSLTFSMPSIDLGPLGKVGGFTIGTPNIPYLHAGGIVPGAPGSDVLAVLQAGERVIPRSRAGGEAGQQQVINVGGIHISGVGSDVSASAARRFGQAVHDEFTRTLREQRARSVAIGTVGA